MGFTWVAADVSYFAEAEAGQSPDFTPRHRRPTLPARAASWRPRSLLARNGQVTLVSGTAAPAAVLLNSPRVMRRGNRAPAAHAVRG
jgi:hypothetical protein